MLAHSFLAAATAHERDRHPAPDELIPLTCNEIQHLFAVRSAAPSGPPAARAGPTDVPFTAG